MTHAETPPKKVHSYKVRTVDVRVLVQYLPVATVVALAAIVRSLSWLNCDVSWLMTVAEKVLAGARPYIDFDEPNPPASFLIYMPAVLLSRVAGVPPELAVTILVFTGALVGPLLAGRILAKAGLLQSAEKPVLFAIACVLLLILPGYTFAQRDDIALLAMLPILAVYAAQASGASVAPIMAALAGIGGGVAMAIKPHFALAVIFPLTYVMWSLRTRGRNLFWLLFSVENLASALILLAYAAAILWRFSDYLQRTLPLVLALYLPLRVSPLLLLGNPSIILVAAGMIGALVFGGDEIGKPIFRVGGLAVLGFTAALMLQGKGFAYHGYPPLALGMVLLALIILRWFSRVSRNGEASRRLRLALAGGAVVLFAELYALESVWFMQGWGSIQAQLVPAVARLVPLHPKIFAIAGGPQVAYPLTRKLAGTPAGAAPFQWISHNADVLLASGPVDAATRTKIESYTALDRFKVVSAIGTEKPDVILVEGRSRETWVFSHAEIAAAFRSYRKAASVADVEIWLPRKPAAKP